MKVPPTRRPATIGRFAGVRPLLRLLAINGPGLPCPRHWRDVVFEQARRMGIRIAARRVGRTDVTVVYRVG